MGHVDLVSPYPTARDLLKMTKAERERHVQSAFAAAQDVDFEVFEANDPIEDFDLS